MVIRRLGGLIAEQGYGREGVPGAAVGRGKLAVQEVVGIVDLCRREKRRHGTGFPPLGLRHLLVVFRSFSGSLPEVIPVTYRVTEKSGRHLSGNFIWGCR